MYKFICYMLFLFLYCASSWSVNPFQLQGELPLQKSSKQQHLTAALFKTNYISASSAVNFIKSMPSILTSDGNIGADDQINAILVYETNTNLKIIKNLIQQIDRPIKQVLIEARIVNLIKDANYDVGLRLGVTTYARSSNIPTDTNILGHLNLDLGAIPIDATPASIGIALAKLSDGRLLDLELSALESEGRAKIIAKPRIVTTNQQEATIASGEDIPYQEITESGATAVSFKKALLSLKVTPNITGDKDLLMKLHINQDSDSGRRVQGVPIIQTKSIDTNVLVKHGQTIVLGGIYKQDKNKVVTRIPVLGEIPFLGNLFRRTQDRVRNEELLIFITPSII